MKVIGHEKVRERILFNEDVPRVSVFLGPHSVGRRRYANHLADFMTNSPQDVLRIHKLSAGLAREAAHFLRIAPAGTAWKVAVIDIDGATTDALSTLLKALEEMPNTSRAILIASYPPPDTILSRAQVFNFTLLSEAEVREVLIDRGFGKALAETAAKHSGGQVRAAIRTPEFVKVKSLVLLATKCIREHDYAGLEQLGGRWADEHTELFVKLCYEATTKRWRVFTEDEIGAISPVTWINLLRVLKTDVRPRLVVHALIAGVVRNL